jgi:pyruvate/2-oxoacid:ferredoxin oxidoreductase alpha subunit
VQEVYDLILAAFRVAEAVHMPALVAYDGFILSHASEPVETMSDAQVDAYLPKPAERPLLDVDKPQQFGEVLFPDYYPDYEYKKHRAVAEALDPIRNALAPFGHDVVATHFCNDAEYVLVGLGSMMETARWTAQRLRAAGEKVGVAQLRSFRPFPEDAVRDAVAGAKTVLVLDRDIGYGTAGMVYPDVTRTLYHSDARPRALNFIVGTGGKDITPQTIERCLELARTGPERQTVFWPDARGPEEGIAYTEGLSA